MPRVWKSEPGESHAAHCSGPHGLGDTNWQGLSGRGLFDGERGGERTVGPTSGDADGVEHAEGDGRREGWSEHDMDGRRDAAAGAGESERLADTDGREPGNGGVQRGREHGQQSEDGGVGFWSDYDILICRDTHSNGQQRARRTQPGLFPLVAGVPFKLASGVAGHGSRAKAIKGIGNAIVPALAALFIRAFLDAERRLSP